MKKIIPFLLISFFAFACGPKDKNIALVKKEFQSYVQKNFDDPKMLKEIVEIIPGDTLSLSKIKGMVAVTDSVISASRRLQSLKDSLSTAELNEHTKTLSKARNISYSDAFSGQLITIEAISIMRKIIDAKKVLAYQNASLDQLCDSLEYKPAIYSYDIKYRKQYPDGIKLETVYAYVDSLSGFKAILTEKSDTEMMSPEYGEVFEKSKDCMVTLNKIEELYQQEEKQMEELIKFVQRF